MWGNLGCVGEPQPIMRGEANSAVFQLPLSEDQMPIRGRATRLGCSCVRSLRPAIHAMQPPAVQSNLGARYRSQAWSGHGALRVGVAPGVVGPVVSRQLCKCGQATQRPSPTGPSVSHVYVAAKSKSSPSML